MEGRLKYKNKRSGRWKVEIEFLKMEILEGVQF